MNRGLAGRAFIMWIVFAFCGILNGVLREEVITPRLGADAGHVVSTIILCCVILVGSLLFVTRLRLTDRRSLLFVGMLWLGLTVAFEFLFGHYVMGHPWERLLADYDITRGRLWVLVLLSELLAPLAMSRVRR